VSNPGKNLDKYQILEEIGRGGMATVYRAYDPALDRTVAIKLLSPHLVQETGFIERFLREARAAAQLQHPHIIPIYDVGQAGDCYYFVMAYLPGPSLRRMIEPGQRLPPARVVAILQQLADALDYAHSKGWVHRDVKPANVILDEQGRAVLTDFGIVRADLGNRLTVTGVVMGTPQYMAPEQVQAAEIDGRTDQYSLGVVAFEMLTGRVPFDAETVTPVLLKQVNEPPPSIVALCPDLSPGVEAVMNRVLGKSPDERYASCGAFVQALQAAMAQPPPLTDTTRPVEMRPAALSASGMTKATGLKQSLERLLDRPGPTLDPQRHRLLLTSAAALVSATFTLFVTAALPYYPPGWRWLVVIVSAGFWLHSPGSGMAVTLAIYLLPIAYNSLGLAGLGAALFLFFGSVGVLNPYSFFFLMWPAVCSGQPQWSWSLLIVPLAMGLMGAKRGAVLGALACVCAQVIALLAGRTNAGILVISSQAGPLLAVRSVPVSSLQDWAWWIEQADLSQANNLFSRLVTVFIEQPVLLGQIILWATAAGVTGALIDRSDRRRALDWLCAVACGALVLGIGHASLSVLLANQSIELRQIILWVLGPAGLVALTSPILETMAAALGPRGRERSVAQGETS
jgi:hypothetical protein